MKLIVTIPALNEEENIGAVIREIPRQIEGIEKVEVLVLNDGSSDRTVEVARQAGADHIISHGQSKGLAKTFADALDEALARGADIIVNTDADNHYNQSRISDLVKPILEKKADIVVANRCINELKAMPFWNRYLNLVGSFITCKIAGLPKIDVSSGFRAYSREAALRLQVYAKHTYCHSTLVQAADQNLVISEVLIRARKVTRKSRLIKGIPSHLARATSTILRNIILFKPLRFFGMLGGLIFLVGFAFVVRFLYYYFVTDGRGHIQSLILAGVLMIIGFQVGILGLIASAIGWSRKMQEEILYRLKKEQYKQ